MKVSTFYVACLVATLAAAVSAAHAADPAQDLYRRAVLGDSSVSTPPMVLVERLAPVPGSYAQYLINQGMARSSAIHMAGLVGEQIRFERILVQVPEVEVGEARLAVRSSEPK